MQRTPVKLAFVIVLLLSPAAKADDFKDKLDRYIRQLREQNKAQFYDSINRLYMWVGRVADRGDIWAQTQDDHNQIRTLRFSLTRMVGYYKEGETAWNKSDYKTWRDKWSRVADEVKGTWPYQYRVLLMISRNGGTMPDFPQ